MDQVRIGRTIAGLRRHAGLTQEALGAKLGVTNKTISRWETGNYMPDIAMLQALAQEFGVSIDELLSGALTSDEGGTQNAVESPAAPSVGSFSFDARRAYFKKKWRREHIALFVILFLILAASIVLPLVCGRPWFVGLSPLIAFVEYGYQNNRMMSYVEHRLYD